MKNSKKSLTTWVINCLNFSSGINPPTIDYLYKIAMAEIEKGGLRGDISELWKRNGVTWRNINDLYLY